MFDSANESDIPPGPRGSCGPDARGQAAILLVESLIHALIARSVISIDDAVEIVSVAAEVQREVIDEASDPRATQDKALDLLQGIQASLSIDL